MRVAELGVDGRFGRIHASAYGPAGGLLVLGLHGLASTHRQLAAIGARLGSQGFRFVALDLRGRGASERTAPGSYGWANHAMDVVAVADALGATRFAVVGVSMGASVAMKAAELAGDRISAVVLIDVAGRVDRTVGPVIAELLASSDPSVADPVAVAEDRAYSGTEDPHARWRHLTMPTLLVRAAREIRPSAGYVVPADERDAFAAAVPSATVVEVDATHLTIADHDDTVHAVADHLAGQPDPPTMQASHRRSESEDLGPSRGAADTP